MPPTALSDASTAPAVAAARTFAPVWSSRAPAPILVTSVIAAPIAISMTIGHVASVHRINLVAVLSLPIGVLVSIMTTTDPNWWHLHFSQLGTYGDVSSRVFNSTMLFAGLFLAVYGVFVGIALPAGTRRRTSRAFRTAITSAGSHLTVIGLIPLSVSVELHDIAATGLGLSFLATVVTALTIPGRTRRFRRATALCVALLTTGMVVLAAGLITLALFEFVAFVSMGIWLTALPRALASRPTADATAPKHDTATHPDGDRESVSSHNPRPAPVPARSSIASIRPAPPRPRTERIPAWASRTRPVRRSRTGPLALRLRSAHQRSAGPPSQGRTAALARSSVRRDSADGAAVVR